MCVTFSPVRIEKASRWRCRAGSLFLCLLFCLSVQPTWAAASKAATAAPAALSMTTDTVAPQRFIAVHGRRALLDGYADGGLEVWAYPVQILSGYQIGFRPQGTSSDIPAASILRRIVYRPD